MYPKFRRLNNKFLETSILKTVSVLTMSLMVLSCTLVSKTSDVSESPKTIDSVNSSLNLESATLSDTRNNKLSEYYNCSNPKGCILIKSKESSHQMTQTQYPIVLVHGFSGFNTLFGVIDYFNGIPEALIEGGSEVYVTKTSAVHNAEYRGEQLLQQIQTITAVTGKEKVNLIGHSLGGIDIRYVAAIAPDKVASVTAVASPEQGSKMADWIIKMLTNSYVTSDAASDVTSELVEADLTNFGKALSAYFKLTGRLLDLGSGIHLNELQVQDSVAGANGLSTQYMTNIFNKKYPAAVPSSYCGNPPESFVVNGIAYYSFSGVGSLTNVADPSDYLLSLTGLSFDKGDLNDGLVSACSSRLGYVIRDDYVMNHLDSVNQISGLIAYGETNPVTVYRTQVNRLKNQGL